MGQGNRDRGLLRLMTGGVYTLGHRDYKAEHKKKEYMRELLEKEIKKNLEDIINEQVG
jgi:hypothetical protein